ncbi:MAG: dephospho-CoA kinase [Leptospirales bacterium]
MIVVGLTGGIASGKSHVARFFEAEGVPVIHSDRLARDVVALGTPGLKAVLEAFPGVRSPDGSLDRKEMARRIFDTPEDRRRLEAILHPLIRDLFHKRLKEMGDSVPVAVYEVPLLFETGLDLEVDMTVVVDVPESVQVDRLVRRDGLSPDDAQRRIKAQWGREDRNRKADCILSGALKEDRLREEVREILKRAGVPGKTLK